MNAAVNEVTGQVRPGVLSLSIKEKSALFAAYMPFIKGGAVRRAHGAAGCLAAKTGSIAHFHRAVERFLVRIIKICFYANVLACSLGLLPEVGGDGFQAAGIDYHAWIQDARRIKNRLDLGEGPHEFRA